MQRIIVTVFLLTGGDEDYSIAEMFEKIPVSARQGVARKPILFGTAVCKVDLIFCDP